VTDAEWHTLVQTQSSPLSDGNGAVGVKLAPTLNYLLAYLEWRTYSGVGGPKVADL